MKKFEEILKMDQKDLKSYLVNYMRSRGYKCDVGDGYLYAKGSVPVLLLAHLDRHPIHKNLVKDIKIKTVTKDNTTETRWSSPQGICGDDRCGVWTIMNIVKSYKPSVLFCEDEEIGSVGCDKFAKTEMAKNLGVDFMVQIDRRGSNDAVFYSCDNKEFTKWIEEVTGYKEKMGTFTDIAKLMPVAKTAAVNLSSGYYNEHTKDEYIVMEELEHTMEAVEKLIKEEIKLKEEGKNKQYNYVKKEYSWIDYGNSGKRWSDGWSGGFSRGYYYDDDYDDGGWGGYNYSGFKKKEKRSKDDTEVTLWVLLEDGTELMSTGHSKPEAWMWLFRDNGSVCYDMVMDYDYM